MTSLIWCFVFNYKLSPYTTKIIGVQWRRGSTYYSHTTSYMCTTKHTPPLQELWFLNVRSLSLEVFTIYPTDIYVIHMHKYLTCLHKANMHNFVTSLTQTFSFEWCVVRSGSQNGYQKIFFSWRDWTACWGYMTIMWAQKSSLWLWIPCSYKVQILWGKWLLPWYAKQRILVACFVSLEKWGYLEERKKNNHLKPNYVSGRDPVVSNHDSRSVSYSRGVSCEEVGRRKGVLASSHPQ